MTHPERADLNFRRALNAVFVFACMGFFTGVFLVVQNWYDINKGALEARFFPVVTDYTHRDWKQQPNGNWSAVVFIYKRRAECVYVREQIETVVAITPSGESVEALIRYVDDPSPGSNRTTGWQRLDARVEFLNPQIVPGSVLRGQILHQCHEGLPTVSTYGPVVVGRDTPLPDYVLAWVENGRVGEPTDYR